MSRESTVKESRAFTIKLTIGAAVLSATIDPDNEQQTINVLNDIVRLAQAPLLGQIETLKKSVLPPEMIERFIHLLKISGTETRFDGKPTNDDLLVKKLEGMLKS